MIDKLKEILNKDKKTSNLVLILILLVVILIATNYIFEDSNEQSLQTVASNIVSLDNTAILENKLANIISKIKGINEADVMISYSRAEKINPVYDIVENTDNTKEANRESTKTTTEKTVAYESRDGSKVAIVESKENAEALGAIVVVSGNVTSIVESNIKQAVSYATNIPIHKIQIFIND